MRSVPQLALDFIKGAEALRLTAYRDSRGRWTIGWGHTGPEVVEGLVVTLAQALAWLMADAAVAARRLAAVVRAEEIAALTEHEYAALISFVFNLGEDPKWNIWRVLNAGTLDAVPSEMMRFDKAHVNGPNRPAVEVPGLMHRRLAEVALWKAPDVGAAVAIVQAAPIAAPPSSETRDMITPPTPSGAAKAFGASKTFVTSCISACAVGASQLAEPAQGIVNRVRTAIEPYVGDSDILQHLHSELAMAAAALSVAVVFFAWLKNHQARTQ